MRSAPTWHRQHLPKKDNNKEYEERRISIILDMFLRQVPSWRIHASKVNGPLRRAGASALCLATKHPPTLDNLLLDLFEESPDVSGCITAE